MQDLDSRQLLPDFFPMVPFAHFFKAVFAVQECFSVIAQPLLEKKYGSVPFLLCSDPLDGDLSSHPFFDSTKSRPLPRGQSVFLEFL